MPDKYVAFWARHQVTTIQREFDRYFCDSRDSILEKDKMDQQGTTMNTGGTPSVP